MSVQVEVLGVRAFGRHGVSDDERATGQWFVVDVALDVGDESPAADAIEYAVDYREVARCARELVEREQFRLLETLAAAVADALLSRFSARAARVSVAKPAVELDGGGKPRVSVVRRSSSA